MAVKDWGDANSRLLSVGAALSVSLDQTSLRPSVIKRIRQIDVKYITHMQSVLTKQMEMYRKNGRPSKNNMASVRSKMRDRSAQNDIKKTH